MIYETIYNHLKKIIPDLDTLEPGTARKSTVSGLMDLNLDVLHRDKDTITIALSHYYQQNGDSIADPDMKIRIIPRMQMAEALTFQDYFGYREAYPEPGKVCPTVKKDLNSFLRHWLKNLKAQRHNLSPEQKAA